VSARITSQPTHVFRPSELPAKDRGAGARTVPLVTSERGATTYLNGMTIFAPGAQIGHHSHNVAESVMVILGRAIVDIDGERHELDTFDTTFVPANVPHHFENVSDTDEMRILWTYGSVDSTRTMVETGETGRIDAERSSSSESGKRTRVTEIAEVDVKEGHETAFEDAVREAAPLFQRADGARTLTLERSIEEPRRYRLFVSWEHIDDHTVGFRGSDDFQEWRALIGPHVEALPRVEHVQNVLTAF
jgi:quercetin dioxygenase-like cupin family protein/quinol monooxygenase YgiN